MGRLRQAQADARASTEVWHGGLETYLPAAVYWFGLASLELGEPAPAQRALSIIGPPERWQATGMMGFIHALQGHLHFHAGQLDESLACQRACGDMMGSLMITNPGVMPWRTHAARAMLALGERGPARDLAEEELALARSSGAPRAIGVSLTTVGMCTGGDVGLERLREAVDVLAPTGAELEHARARRAIDTGAEVLTASERRVAELAALGHTDRAIAGGLQISIKAVEWHLHQGHRKLEIQSRRQLSAALGRVDDVAAAVS